MATPVHALLFALVAAAFWTALGYALTRHVLPRALSIGAAPVVGWAVFSAATLPILGMFGFSPVAVFVIAVLCLLVAGISFTRSGADTEPAPAAPPWSYAAAGILAIAPASAILPKISADEVRLADPIFDHSKIAIIDAMMRQGLPAINPVFGEFGAAGRLVYYYLWHFSAAELALPLGLTGWEADIGLTWFTAFASLTLMMAVAVWFSKCAGAAPVAVALAAAASLRETLRWLTGSYGLEPFLATPTGFAGWLFQSAWVPQHLMAASCTVAAILLLVEYARVQSLSRFLVLVLLVTAGFECSTYVGGVTFALAAMVDAPILMMRADPDKRLRFAAGLAAAAVLVLVIAAPFIRDQFATVALRGGGSPIVLFQFPVLGSLFPATLRRLLDAPAYWLILLPVEFPATFIAGAIALAVMWRNFAAGSERTAVAVLAMLAGVGLVVSWLLVSKLGENNDLALRAVLPAAMVLIAGAAAGLSLSPRRMLIAATATGGLVLGLPDTVAMVAANFTGKHTVDDRTFAQSPELWTAVRRYAAPTARIANNPLYLQDLTPWPVNISWALLADRSSCFAGRELALVFAPLSFDRRETINAQFVRVFAGQGTPADVGDMAGKFACDVVVVVPQDGAWNNDPFASAPDYRLAEFRDGQWRIYVKASGGSAPR